MKSIFGKKYMAASLLLFLGFILHGCGESTPRHVLRYNVQIQSECGISDWTFDIDRITALPTNSSNPGPVSPIEQVAKTVYASQYVSANCEMTELEVVSMQKAPTLGKTIGDSVSGNLVNLKLEYDFSTTDDDGMTTSKGEGGLNLIVSDAVPPFKQRCTNAYGYTELGDPRTVPRSATVMITEIIPVGSEGEKPKERVVAYGTCSVATGSLDNDSQMRGALSK